MNPALLDKIRKLRALSQSDNVHEAAAAAAKAEALIQEHRLAEADLETPEEREAVQRVYLDDAEESSYNPKLDDWRWLLVNSLALHHGCAAWAEREVARVKHRNGHHRVLATRIRLTGTPGDLAIVRYFYSWLRDEIERLLKLSKLRAGMSFRLGAVHAIVHALDKSRETVRSQATSTALAIVDQRLAIAQAALPKDLTEQNNPDRFGSMHAYRKGYQAGASIGLHKPLDGAPSAGALPGLPGRRTT